MADDLANVNSHDTGDYLYGRSPLSPRSHYHVVDRAEVIDRAVPVHVLDPVPGVNDRPQKGWIAFFTGGQLLPWQRNTGAHGVIGLPRQPPNMEGGQHAYPNWNPRTFRAAPLVPWDEGSEVA